MPINLYQTQTMLAAIQLMPKRPTFLRDRYFPTTDKDIFLTEDVLVEYKDEKSRKLAPCVVPMKGGIPVARDGYKTERYTPANVAPERVLTIDQLNKKQFGETLFSQKKPAEREASILKGDIQDLGELIDSREEYMAAQTLFNNGYSMKHYADQYGGDKYEEFQIHFYDGERNGAIYTPSNNWTTSTPATVIMMDLYNMAMMNKKRGLPAIDVLFGEDVAAVLLGNESLQTLMNNRRLDLVSINPTELPQGVTSYGKINCMGVVLELFCCAETYVDEAGVDQTYIPKKQIVVTAPAVGRTLYGAVTQIEESDRAFHTYAAPRVPHIVTNVKDGIRTLTEKAKPLTVPNFQNSSISATVLD